MRMRGSPSITSVVVDHLRQGTPRDGSATDITIETAGKAANLAANTGITVRVL